MAKKKKKNKRRRKEDISFFVDRNIFWKPGVGIRCNRCKCGMPGDFGGAKTIHEAIENIKAYHTKKDCDDMVKLNEELENHCPYPCCKDKRKKRNGKSKKK